MNQTVLQKVISSNLLMKKGYIDSMENVLYYYFIHIDRGAVKQVTKIWQGVRDDDEGYQVMDEG